LSDWSRRKSPGGSDKPPTPPTGAPSRRISTPISSERPPDSRAPPPNLSPDAPIHRGSFTIINARGLHARAATKLVQLASRYACEIIVTSPDGQEANAKSVMGVLLLCGSVGTTIQVRARGPGADTAVEAIGALIADRFGEAE
jgi:phosphocarrier protein HPr